MRAKVNGMFARQRRKACYDLTVCKSLKLDDVLFDAFSRYGRSDCSFYEDNVQRMNLVTPVATDVRRGALALRAWFVKMGLQVSKPLAWESCIPFITDFSTSPGWPYLLHGYTQRGQLLVPSRRSQFFALCQDYEDSKRQAVWSLRLKDEVLKRKKIVNGIARMFIICPAHVQFKLLKHCALFNDFVKQMSERERLPIWLSRSSLGGSWSRVFKQWSGRVVGMDEDAWDMSLHRSLFEQLYALRSCFSVDFPTDFLIREVCETIFIVPSGEIMQKKNGNSSGSSNTTVDNSLILLMFYLDEFLSLYPESDVDEFMGNVIVCGDDNICNYTQKYPLFTPERMKARLNAAGISTRLESDTIGPVGGHFIAKDVVDYPGYGLMPRPQTARVLGHLWYSTPGGDLLLTGMKVNSMIMDCAWNDEVLPYLLAVQAFVLAQLGPDNAIVSEVPGVSEKAFRASIFPLADIRYAYTGWESRKRYQCRYKNDTGVMPQKQKQKKKKFKQIVKQKVIPAAKKSMNVVRQVAKVAASTPGLGGLVKSIPVVGPMLDTAFNVGKSILNFVGLGAGVYAYVDLHGRHHLVAKDSHLESKFEAGTEIPAGSVILKYVISVGPDGTRSRELSKLFEKYTIQQMDLVVTPTASMTSTGVLAYFLVPDVESKTIDDMSPEQLLATAPTRPSYRQINIRTAGRVRIPLPRNLFYIKDLDGAERFVSPGILYIITVSQVNSANLPVIEQQSKYGFYQPSTTAFHDQYYGMTTLCTFEDDYAGKARVGVFIPTAPLVSGEDNRALSKMSVGSLLTGFMKGALPYTYTTNTWKLVPGDVVHFTSIVKLNNEVPEYNFPAVFTTAAGMTSVPQSSLVPVPIYTYYPIVEQSALVQYLKVTTACTLWLCTASITDHVTLKPELPGHEVTNQWFELNFSIDDSADVPQAVELLSRGAERNTYAAKRTTKRVPTLNNQLMRSRSSAVLVDVATASQTSTKPVSSSAAQAVTAARASIRAQSR